MTIDTTFYYDKLFTAATANGWSMVYDQEPVFATREVNVPYKKTLAFLLCHCEDEQLTLRAEYILNGKNILSLISGRVSIKASDSEINLAVCVFIGLVNTAIIEAKLDNIRSTAESLCLQIKP